MCELLALSANTPTDMTFSFRGLARRGGATGDHADGWGLASYSPAGQGVTIVREEGAAAFSSRAAATSNQTLKTLCSIAHIRKATRGAVAIENCHPFHRRWHGQDWVFAHNGDLPHGTVPPPRLFVPLGTTDSEEAFCWILEELDRTRTDPDDRGALFDELRRCAERLAEQGIFNGLLSNGQWLFAFGGTRLHWLTRRAPFGTATLADDDLTVDFSQVAGPLDVVTIVSTEPLTLDEPWMRLAAGEALLLEKGEVRAHHQPALA